MPAACSTISPAPSQGGSARRASGSTFRLESSPRWEMRGARHDPCASARSPEIRARARGRMKIKRPPPQIADLVRQLPVLLLVFVDVDHDDRIPWAPVEERAL